MSSIRGTARVRQQPEEHQRVALSKSQRLLRDRGPLGRRGERQTVFVHTPPWLHPLLLLNSLLRGPYRSSSSCLVSPAGQVLLRSTATFISSAVGPGDCVLGTGARSGWKRLGWSITIIGHPQREH